MPDLEFKIPANRTRWFSLLYIYRFLRRAEAGLKLPGQLHPPRRAEQPPYRRRRCAFHLSRLPPRFTAQEVNPLRLGVPKL
jgi:hypothetical protein